MAIAIYKFSVTVKNVFVCSIKLFRASAKLLSDNGCEFNSNEIHKLDVKSKSRYKIQ